MTVTACTCDGYVLSIGGPHDPSCPVKRAIDAESLDHARAATDAQVDIVARAMGSAARDPSSPDYRADARALLARLATTPSDDRGREVAEARHALDSARFDAGVSTDRELADWVRTRRAEQLRALAAPVETEAGNRITDWPERPSNAAIARMFHEEYERLAPLFGYRTREESAKPWDEVPETNRLLMGATVGGVMVRLFGDAPDDPDPLAATPPAPEGEADADDPLPLGHGRCPECGAYAPLVLDEHPNPSDPGGPPCQGTGFDVEDLLLGAAEDQPAPASPQAEGAGETGVSRIERERYGTTDGGMLRDPGMRAAWSDEAASGGGS